MEELIKKYVKDNNIISYLNWKLDSNNIMEILDKNYILESDETLEDEAYWIIQDYNYNLAKEIGDTKKIADYIYGCEFDIMVDKEGKISLKDLQGAYLGGNYDDFDTIIEASERLEGSFYRDYYGMEIY